MNNATAGHAALPRLTEHIGLRDGVAERLFVAVLDGGVEAGERLVGQHLAAQLGVSATPVREAWIQLATLGFVELLPNRGAVCREFGPRELHDIFQVRRTLEVEAAELARERMSEHIGSTANGVAKVMFQQREG